MEAAVKRTTPTAHPSDANMDPEGARKRLWFNEMCIFIEAPEEGMSTCRSEHSEDSESKPHKDGCLLDGKRQGDSGSACVEHAGSFTWIWWW